MLLTSSILDSRWTVYTLLGIVGAQVFYTVYSALTYPTSNKAETAPDHGEDVDEPVQAYVFPGNDQCASASNFSIKLLAYLRFAGIPHTVHEADFQSAPKGKVPYIKHNGNIIGDSQLIIRYLENTYDIKTMAKIVSSSKVNLKPFVPFTELSAHDQALSESIRLLCEGQIYWTIISVRFLGASGLSERESNWTATCSAYFADMPFFIRPILTRIIRNDVFKSCWAFGLARHSAADQMYLLKRAIRSLSTLLGDKLFFLGDFPSEVDCAALGIIQCMCDDSLGYSPHLGFIKEECMNLWEYKSRMRPLVFPDMSPGMKLAPAVVEGCKPKAKKQKTG